MLSERKACKLVGLHRTAARHKIKEEDKEIENEILRIAYRKKRFGYRRIYDLLRKKFKVNHKKVYRIYTKNSLKYRRKKSKKRYIGEKVPLVIPAQINERWSMDFINDSLNDCRRFRVFNLIDDLSRESIVQHADFSISGKRLVRIFEELKLSRTLPKQIVCDNGTEFTSKVFMKWAADNNVELCFIDKGKPMQNGYIESFNGKFRDECLNEELFLSIQDARDKIKAWQKDYNTERPHSSLNGLSPYEFISKIA